MARAFNRNHKEREETVLAMSQDVKEHVVEAQKMTD